MPKYRFITSGCPQLTYAAGTSELDSTFHTSNAPFYIDLEIFHTGHTRPGISINNQSINVPQLVTTNDTQTIRLIVYAGGYSLKNDVESTTNSYGIYFAKIDSYKWQDDSYSSWQTHAEFSSTDTIVTISFPSNAEADLPIAIIKENSIHF